MSDQQRHTQEELEKKAEYMATQEAFEWAGAVKKANHAFGRNTIHLQIQKSTTLQTDQPTDGKMD